MQPFELIQISNHSPRRRGTFECYTRALVEAVRDAGGTSHLVYFAQPDKWFSEWMGEAGALTYGLPYELTEPEQPWRIALTVRKLRPPLSRTLVHVQFPILNGICPALRAMGFRRIILSDQLSGVCRRLPSSLRSMKNLMNRLQVSGASAITALSSHIMERQVAAGIPADRTRVLHIGCDLNEYTVPTRAEKSMLRKEHGFHEGNVVVCFTGRLIREKGVDVLLKAVPAVARDFPGIRVLIVGQGDEEAALQTMSRNLGLSECVRFTGHAPSVVPYLQASDIFVCPSVWEEGFGYVNIEAMAVGLPVIASRVGGITDIVTDGEDGFLVDPGNADALAEKIQLLVASCELREELGVRAQRSVRATFSLKETITRTMDLYINLLNSDA